MRVRRFLPVVLLALFGLLVAGCGGGSSKGVAGGSTPSGASMVRAGVLAFVAVDSDLGSDEWQQVDALARKFPGREKAIAQLKQSLTKEGVDYDRDVKPALGPEVDVAVVSAGSSSSTKVVALTKPDDARKFRALVSKLNASDSSGSKAVYREVDGWYALSDSQAAITDIVATSGKTLDGDGTFSEALGKLPDDALVKAYLDGKQLNEVIRTAAAQSGAGLDAAAFGLDKLEYVAASASAEDDGLRVRGASSGADLGSGDFSSKLIEGVPGDAFAFLSFDGAGTSDQLERLKTNPQVGAALGQIQAMLGVTFDQLLALLRGEVAFYSRPGAVIPEFTLALEERDQSSALATLDKLAARLSAGFGGRVVPGEQGGHAVETIDLGRFAIHYGGLGDKVLITSGVNGIADYGASGEHLPDSADFEDAKEAAGLPDSNGGFMYLDLKNALPLLEGFAGLSGQNLPPEVTENLRPLRSFLAWSAGSGGTRTFDAFLEIK
jgi:Protein of unknown function (DUF3352)